MKYLIAIAAACSLAGCAGAQTKIEHVKNQVDCYADLLIPYSEYLTEQQIHDVLNGEDFTPLLEVAGALPAEIAHIKEGIAACKALK